MNREVFIRDYAAALATQDWEQVAPLIHTDACVTFSNGSVHKGKKAIGEAYSRNFSLIKNEEYAISDVYWIDVRDDVAAYTFRFSWKGVVNGQSASGAGRGTAVIKLDGGKWKLMAEHLGRDG